MIITITMNPAIDKTLEITQLCKGNMNRVIHSCTDAGGKGINVSKTVKALGGESIATGIICGVTGKELLELLKQQNIKTDFLEISGNTRTNLKIVEENGTVTEINEKGPWLSLDEQEDLKDKISKLVDENSLVVLSGSVPLGVTDDFYKELISMIQRKSAKVFLDADGELFRQGILAAPYMIKPNREELMEYFHWSKFPPIEQVVLECKKFIHMGIKKIVISLGKDGALFMDEEHTYIGKSLNVDVSSTVGAGDAMLGAMIYGMEEKIPYPDVLKLMMATSAGAVITRGTKPSNKEFVNTLIHDVNIEQYS